MHHHENDYECFGRDELETGCKMIDDRLKEFINEYNIELDINIHEMFDNGYQANPVRRRIHS